MLEQAGNTDTGLMVESQARLTTRGILKELGSLANRNIRFRENTISEFQFSVQETDAFLHRVPDKYYDPQDEIDIEGEDTLDLGSIRVTYDFKAQRIMLMNRFERCYSLTVMADNVGVDIPPHITQAHQDLLGVDPHDDLSDSTFMRAMTFSIDTNGKYLMFCDSRTYVDFEGDVVNTVCNCSENDAQDPVYFRPILSDEDDERDSDSLSHEERLIQRPRDELLYRMESEKVCLESPEEALREWINASMIEPLDPVSDSIWHDRKLALAMGALNSLKRVLGELSGTSE